MNAVAGQVIERTVSLQELPADQNPYARKPAPPAKWYQKWWVWTAAAAGVASGGDCHHRPGGPVQSRSLLMAS